MKKAVAYARFSSDNQTENSIEAQVHAIKEYCKKENIIIEKWYIDRELTATNTDREEFQDMMHDVRLNNYDYVLFHKSDRLARNRFDAMMVKRDIRATGAEIVFMVGGNYDVEVPEEMLMEAFQESLDQYYSMNLSRETKKGLNNMARKGYHTGGLPPYGYELNDNKEYIPHPVQSKAVALVFDLFNQNYGYLKIAQELNEKGFRTRNNRKFSKSSIFEMVRNEKYTGTMVFNKYEKGRRNRQERDDVIKVENAFEAIIDKDTFLKAQGKINKRSKPRMNNNRIYFLTGKVKCECGGNMVGNQYGSGKYRYYWYACNRKRNKQGCDIKDIKADELERLTIQLLIDEVFNDALINKISDEAKRRFKEKDKGNDEEKRHLAQKKATAEINMNKAIDLYMEDIITKEQLEERTRANKHDIEVIDHRLQEIKKDSQYVDIKSLVTKYVNSLSVDKVLENKKLAIALIDEFVVSILINDESIKFTYKYGDPYPIVTLSYNIDRDTKDIFDYDVFYH